MGGTMKSIGWMVAAWLVLIGCGEHGGGEPATSQASYLLDPLTLNGRCATIMRQTRYLDAYTSSPSGNVVTRPQQADDTQRWCFTQMGTDGNPPLTPYFTVQHRSFDGQFLDAHENSNGHGAVLRDAQQDDSQNWVLEPMGSGFAVKQRSSSRFLTSSTLLVEDWRASTSTTATEWVITPIVDCDPTTISDPRTVTALDPTLVTSFASAAAPLYEGALAIQKQVTPGVIDPKRVSVIEGRARKRVSVFDPNGVPVCAKVTVVGQPSLGTSYVKQDGSFSIALNGGATSTVRIEYPGYIPAYRTVTPLPNRFAYASEVRLQAHGSARPVSASATSTTVVAGASETDAEGTRTAVLLFPSGTTASVAGEASPRTSYSVRVKELTNRDQVGREGMPASLPPQSAFTYAVSLAIDGAENKAVTFNKPIPVYVENFLGFPNGQIAPVGRFDPTTAQWVAEANGRVIRIHGVTAGQADLDIDENLGADDAAPLGVTTAERVALAARYPVNTSLWRFETSHFSLWDVNWGWGPPPTAQAPDNDAPESPDEDDPCEASGSIIECETQVLRENIPVTATPYSLVYSSARQPGSARRMNVPLTGATLPPDLQAIDVRIEVGGRTFTPSVPVTPNLTYEFVWDGLDVAGRRPSGPQLINTSVGYVYNGSYQQTARFGYNGNGTPISAAIDRFQATLFQYASGTLGTIDAAYAGLGGWTLDVHHVLDPQTGTVYLGNGKRKRGSSVLTTFAGTGQEGHTGDGGPATAAALDLNGREGNAVAVSAAGAVYYTDGANYVRKIDTNGIITSVAGDGGATQLSQPSGIAIAPSGDIYIADSISCRIRKLTSSGALTTVAGAFLASPACVDRSISSDGPADPLAAGAATFAIVRKLALAPDGTLYIAERTKLRRLRDGQVSTVASGFNQLYGVAIAGDGTLFVSDAAGKVHRISSDGDVTDFAGGGASTTDGVPATSAVLSSPQDIAIGPDGLVYVAETGDNRIRRINGDGTIQTVAGTRVAGLGGDGHPTATKLNRPGGLTFGPDGALYIIDSLNHRLRKISPKPGINLGGGAFGVASLDGQELFHFDASGRHLRTRDTHTGAAIHTFGYAGSVLTSVTDVSGRVTTIARSGSTITLTAPDQQPTTLLLDAEQNLERVTRPDGTFYTFDYAPGRLLRSMKDPKANAEAGLPAVFEYDNGLLVADTDARPGASPQTLERSQLAGTTGWSVTHTTPLGRTTEYGTELASGIRTRTVTRPDGTQAIERRREDGALVFTAPGGATYDQHVTAPDGTEIWTRTQRNPAYGGKTNLAADTLTRLPSGLTRAVTESTAATINPSTGTLLTETITTTTNGLPSTITYNATTRTFTTTTRAGRTNERELDLSGRIARLRVSGILHPTSFEYDAAGRLSRIIHGTRNTDLDYFPGGSGLKSGYLESTQTYAGSSPPLTATTFDRDALGRVLFSTTGSATTATTWDENGNLESVTPPGQPIHILGYDAINQLTTYLPPAIPEAPAPGTSYLFDADRTLDTETRPGSVLLNPSYDAAGRLDSLAFPGGFLDPSYYGTSPPSGGAPGKPSSLLGPYGVNLAYQYDGSLTKKVTWSGLVSGAIEWTYDSDFVPTIETVTPGTGPAVPVHFGYDADDLPTCASLTTCDPAGADALAIARSPSNGSITSITLGNVTETFRYNDHGEPAFQSSTFGTRSLLALTYDSASFPRDALGRITRKRETLPGTTTNFDYTYDDQGRLTDVFRNGLAHEHFDYDDAGNRTLGYNAAAGTTYIGAHDDQDRLRTYGPWTYTYTPHGELSTKSGAGQTWTYGYDALGNLLSVTLPSGTAITYLVDGQNRRVGKRVNGTLVKQWLYKDGLRPVAELNGSGAVVARFVYASDRNTPDFIVRSGSRYRVLTDQLGSPRMAVNVTNATDVPFHAEYTAFGVQTMLGGTAADWMPFGFAGGMSDPETGLVRFGARDYDPMVGRWTAKDPLRFDADGTGFYVYGLGDPVNRRDPTGLFSGCEEGIAARIAVGALAGGAVGGPWGALVGAAIVAGLVPSDTPANDNAGDRPQLDTAGGSSKGPPGPKSKGICDLTFDLIEAGSGSHTCHYFCAQDGSRPKFSMPNSLPCPERVGWRTGR